MTPEEDSSGEATLRQAVLAGDEYAWRLLYDREFEPLHAYVTWRCGGRGDMADDLVQETWMVAVRRVRDFDPQRGTFLQWLRGIAANLMKNFFRLRSTVAVHELPDLPARFDADAERREQSQRIAVVLAELPETYENVLRAKYLDGRSVDEIAAEFGQSPKAVESLLTRARQAFRTAFSPKDAESSPNSIREGRR